MTPPLNQTTPCDFQAAKQRAASTSGECAARQGDGMTLFLANSPKARQRLPRVRTTAQAEGV
mgnify:CR=1 FL=1